jgi:hypothetical protein
MTTSRISEPNEFDTEELRRNLHDCNTLHNAVGSLNPRNPGLHNDLIQFAKKLTRRGLSWYTRPLHQFQGAVTRTLNELAKGLENTGARLGLAEKALENTSSRLGLLESSWRQNIPAFLNAVSSVGAFGHELARLRRELEQGLQAVRHDLRQEAEQELQSVRHNLQQTSESVARSWEPIDLSRCEMLYEMKYGRRISGASAPHVEARIVAPEKVAAARQFGLKLNLGCGHLPVEGYVNVDRRELPGVDVVADVGDLPFEEGGVQEISSAHLLEHFPQEILRRRLLPFWRTLLMPGGAFRAVVPDGEAMLAGIAGGTYSFSHFREVLFGAQDYDGDFHFNLFTPDSLRGLLEEAGFKDIRVNARARPNGTCFEFEVSAVKPPFDSTPNRLSSCSSISVDEPGANMPASGVR